MWGFYAEGLPPFKRVLVSLSFAVFVLAASGAGIWFWAWCFRKAYLYTGAGTAAPGVMKFWLVVLFPFFAFWAVNASFFVGLVFRQMVIQMLIAEGVVRAWLGRAMWDWTLNSIRFFRGLL